MKAITIYQPWASLIAAGAKIYETRGWATNYRGPIAIHAGKKNPSVVLAAVDIGIVSAIGRAFGLLEKPITDIIEYLDSLPLGAVIATAELVECHCIVQKSPSTGRIVTDRGIITPMKDELLFGDWTPYRYAWQLANVQMLAEPIPARGQQGLWNWRTTG